MKKVPVFLILILMLTGVAIADTLVIPAGVNMIEEEAFYGDTSLDDVILPEGLLYIANKAFSQSSIKKIYLPTSLSYIAEDAFPAGIRMIAEPGSYAYEWIEQNGYNEWDTPSTDFVYNANNGEITITQYKGKDEIVHIPSEIDGQPVRALGWYVFKNNSELKEITFPSTLTKIGYGAFEGCTGLSALDIPEGVMTIERYAFHGCTGLTEVHLPESLTKIEQDVFWNCSGLESLCIPSQVNAIYSGTFAECSNLNDIRFEGDITSLGAGAFAETGFTEFQVPAGIKMIDNTMFAGCSQLEKVILPDGVSSIMSGAFQNCTALTEINLPESLLFISLNAFTHCESLVSITIPKNCKADTIFNSCYSLRQVVLEDGVENCPGFTDCINLESITMPDTIRSMGLFINCYKLETVNMSDNITRIPEQAFKNCVALKNVHMSSKMKNIARNAFENCRSLEELYLPATVNYIGTDCFKGCGNLSNLRFEPGSYVENWAEDQFTHPTYCYMALNQTLDEPVHFLSGKSVEYEMESSDRNIVQVNGHSIIAIENGEATITISVSGNTKKSSMRVYVGLELNRRDLTIEKGSSEKLTPTYNVFLQSNDLLTMERAIWSSSDETIAYVDSQGNITGIRLGEATVTLSVPTNSGTMIASCVVTVVPAQNDLDRMIDRIEIDNNTAYIFFERLIPENEMTFDYQLYSSEEKDGTYEPTGSTWSHREAGDCFVINIETETSLYIRILVTERLRGTPVRTKFTNSYNIFDDAYNAAVYRAVLIGIKTFQEEIADRNVNDLTLLKAAFANVNDNKIQIHQYIDIASAAAMKNTITSEFSAADYNDVSILFITTHGANPGPGGAVNGDMLLKNNVLYRISELAETMKQISGTKIVLLGSCLSGNAVDLDDFHGTYVITGGSGDQETAGSEMPGSERNAFAQVIFEAIGTSGDMPADTSKDGKLSLSELYSYLRINVPKLALRLSLGKNPHVPDKNFTDQTNFPVFWR